MGDEDSAKLILEATKPGKCKSLGRKVTNWSQEKWDANKFEIGVTGALAKFSQNKHMGDELLSTGDCDIAEASPGDTIWGIGISVEQAEAGVQWKGGNLLGKILVETRK